MHKDTHTLAETRTSTCEHTLIHGLASLGPQLRGVAHVGEDQRDLPRGRLLAEGLRNARVVTQQRQRQSLLPRLVLHARGGTLELSAAADTSVSTLALCSANSRCSSVGGGSCSSSGSGRGGGAVEERECGGAEGLNDAEHGCDPLGLLLKRVRGKGVDARGVADVEPMREARLTHHAAEPALRCTERGLGLIIGHHARVRVEGHCALDVQLVDVEHRPVQHAVATSPLLRGCSPPRAGGGTGVAAAAAAAAKGRASTAAACLFEEPSL